MKTLDKIGVAVALLLSATQFSFAQATSAPAAPQDSVATASQAAEPVEAVAPAIGPAPAIEPALATEPAPAIEPVSAVAPVAAKAETPSEPLEIHYGARGGLGISGFNGHKALKFDGISTQYGINMGFSLTYSIGFASTIKINNLLSVAPELQFSYYSASGEATVDTDVREFERMMEAYAYMYSIELPVMARFNVGNLLDGLYLEVGPQFGYNIYSKIYKNNVPYKPDVNAFAFGPSIGGGVNLNGVLAGIRCYYGIIEYAKNSDGYPWTVQASLTKFFFKEKQQ